VARFLGFVRVCNSEVSASAAADVQSGVLGTAPNRGGTSMKRLAVAVDLVVSLAGLVVASPAHGLSKPPGPPDTYVTAWDAIGTQAFGAAALSPAEGHTIFAYVAIAVYDSVMAVEGGYESFAVDVDPPAGASAEAAVAAAAHRILTCYLPGQAVTILNPAYVASTGLDAHHARRMSAMWTSAQERNQA
jgi:hypothetical protein